MTGADGELVLSDVGPAPVRFMAATGCADYPEAEPNVSGPHLSGPTPNAEVQGFVATHLHVTAHEFLGGRVHCGRPWHPYEIGRAHVRTPITNAHIVCLLLLET